MRRIPGLIPDIRQSIGVSEGGRTGPFGNHGTDSHRNRSGLLKCHRHRIKGPSQKVRREYSEDEEQNHGSGEAAEEVSFGDLHGDPELEESVVAESGSEGVAAVNDHSARV